MVAATGGNWPSRRGTWSPVVCYGSKLIFAMRDTPTPVSWLGSHTKDVIAAMSGDEQGS